jgi:hypothetical protein
LALVLLNCSAVLPTIALPIAVEASGIAASSLDALELEMETLFHFLFVD